MKPKKKNKSTLFNHRSRLVDILNLSHPLCTVGDSIDWQSIEDRFLVAYSENRGSPGKEIRLMVGLHYLKYTYSLSDEEIVFAFVENPYYQYFCGNEFFEHKFPIDPSSMTRFRKRLASHDLEGLLEETIKAGLKLKVITVKSFVHVNVDTTVQEKNVAFPTDAKLYFRCLNQLVEFARESGIALRQSFKKKSKEYLLQHGRYLHAKQFNRGKRVLKKLKCGLGYVSREIARRIEEKGVSANAAFAEKLRQAERLLSQTKESKQKLYSLHEPGVQCIAKGKAHKRYEFGSKVSFTTTSQDNFIIGALSFEGNPYDGHTLNAAMKQSEALLGRISKKAVIAHGYVDRGYKGHNYEGNAQIVIQKPGLKKKLSRKEYYYVKRRSAIEPMIGHMKEDGRLKRNFLKGIDGDRFNALLAACGQNMRKLIKFLIAPIFALLFSFFCVEKQEKIALL